jgi:hypothetical protein
LPAKEERLVRAMFDVSTTVHVGDGWNALFWWGRWLGDMSIQTLAPNLCPAVRTRMRATRLVHDALRDDLWIRDIVGVLNMAALEQYVQL